MASLKALVLRVRPSPTPPNSVMEMLPLRNPNGTIFEHDTVSPSLETNQQQHKHTKVKKRRRIFAGSDSEEKRRTSETKRALSAVKDNGFCYVCVVGESIKSGSNCLVLLSSHTHTESLPFLLCCKCFVRVIIEIGCRTLQNPIAFLFPFPFLLFFFCQNLSNGLKEKFKLAYGIFLCF